MARRDAKCFAYDGAHGSDIAVTPLDLQDEVLEMTVAAYLPGAAEDL